MVPSEEITTYSGKLMPGIPKETTGTLRRKNLLKICMFSFSNNSL
jgi:hypothetical protein